MNGGGGDAAVWDAKRQATDERKYEGAQDESDGRWANGRQGRMNGRAMNASRCINFMLCFCDDVIF